MGAVTEVGVPAELAGRLINASSKNRGETDRELLEAGFAKFVGERTGARRRNRPEDSGYQPASAAKFL
jgi:hypothetical protein